MRGVHSAVDDIRRNVFTEVARLAYESDDLTQVDMIPYKLIQGEIAQHRHDVFLERAVVAAKRENVIQTEHLEEGCVAGAAREALNQITPKALGMSVGGKIGIARSGDHVAVAVFFGIGLGHLDEICIGLGHRAI